MRDGIAAAQLAEALAEQTRLRAEHERMAAGPARKIAMVRLRAADLRVSVCTRTLAARAAAPTRKSAR